jgi:cytosine permease
MAVILAMVGIAVAATNVWAMFIPWLSLLGILIPPIGAIMIVDLYFSRPNAVSDCEWRGKSFAAWIIGSLAAFAVEGLAPGLSTAISAFVVAAIAYWLISASERRASAAVRYEAT